MAVAKKIELQLDPDSLTLGDLEDFEEVVGKPLDEILKPVPSLDADGNRVFDAKGRPEMTVKVSAKAITCLVWLTQRQALPDFTLADARKVRVSALVLPAVPEDAKAAEGKS